MNERTLPLQGIRVLLMLGLVLLHTYFKNVFGDPDSLTSFFFVVSGFLYSPKGAWMHYMKKKVKALYPVFWIVLVLSIFVSILRGQYSFSLDIIPHFLLIQTWWPFVNVDAMGYIGVSWFLSCLLVCYILSPLLYKYISRFNKPTLLLSVVGIYMLRLLWIGNASVGNIFSHWYTWPPFRLADYSMGMMGMLLVKDTNYKHANEVVSLIVLSAYLCFIWAAVGGGKSAMVHLMMIMYIYKYRSKMITALLANKFVVWLSQYVMFVFISHQSITNNLLRGHLTENQYWICVIACFLVGILYGKLYNSTIRRWIKL